MKAPLKKGKEKKLKRIIEIPLKPKKRPKIERNLETPIQKKKTPKSKKIIEMPQQKKKDKTRNHFQPIEAKNHLPSSDSFTRIQTLRTKDMTIKLTNLNSYINKWFILEIIKKQDSSFFHLENTNKETTIELYAQGFKLKPDAKSKISQQCKLWENKKFDITKVDLKSFKKTFYPLCNNNLFIRLNKPSKTKLSMIEKTTSLLRKTEIGEDIINIFKPIMVDMEAEADKGVLTAQTNVKHVIVRAHTPAKIAMKDMDGYDVISENHQLGIEIRDKNATNIKFGKWYETKKHAGIFVSLFKPDLIDPVLFKTYKNKVRKLTADEKDKLVYTVAYDLDKFSINYALGTKHPNINTHEKTYTSSEAAQRRNIVPIGSIPPYELQDAVGVFVGGFKSSHGRFKRGALKGKTYGYIENGVELESMSPGLATVYVSNETGNIDILTWPHSREKQKALKKKILAARQNGSMLMENSIPGPYVNSWTHGNWSGDANGLGRSLRSGICIQNQNKKKFLLFMAFYSATPSSMARTMQAYSCKDAMHLDMNAHMYLHNAIFSYNAKNGYDVQYLNTEMLYPKTLKQHRFIMDNNERDFFYIKSRKTQRNLYVEQ